MVCGNFLWGGAGLFGLSARFEIVGEPAPRAIDSMVGLRTIAHSPVSIELYRLRLFLEDLTAEGAEGPQEEMRGMNNSDVKGLILAGDLILSTVVAFGKNPLSDYPCVHPNLVSAIGCKRKKTDFFKESGF